MLERSEPFLAPLEGAGVRLHLSFLALRGVRADRGRGVVVAAPGFGKVS